MLLTKVQVRKRGGGLEPWNIEKVINSTAVAGLSMKEAEALGALIEAWAEKNAENGVISSIQIRDKVIEVLGLIDSMAGESYKTYKK